MERTFKEALRHRRSYYALAPEYLMQNPYFFSEAADAVSLYSASAAL